MADKEIYIDKVRVGYGTKATVKKELSTEETPTFDGKLIDSDPNPAVTISIETLRAGTVKQYTDLVSKLKYAETNPVTVQIVEKVTGKEQMIVKDFAYNALLSSNEHTLEPAKRTAVGLEFKAQSHKQTINDKEI